MIADINRWRAIDFLEHAWMQRVYPCVYKVGNRLAGLLCETRNHATVIDLHDASGRRLVGMEYRQSRDRPVLTMHVDQGPQVEIREVVSVTGQEHVVLANPVPAGGKRARAAEQLRLEDRTYSRRPITRGEVTAHHVWQVMEVDENLVDTCGVERLEPDIDQGPPVGFG